MIYVETDFVLALAKDEDWLEINARAYLDRFQGEFTTSLVNLHRTLPPR